MGSMNPPIILKSWHQALGLPNDFEYDSDPASIFQYAIESFQNTLSEDDRKLLKPAEDVSGLISDLVDHCKKLKDPSKLLLVCKSIDRCARRLQPFFEIVGIVIKSNPDWAAGAWGAIKLVFLVRL
jgi:hypothetical protein